MPMHEYLAWWRRHRSERRQQEGARQQEEAAPAPSAGPLWYLKVRRPLPAPSCLSLLSS